MAHKGSVASKAGNIYKSRHQILISADLSKEC